ncbi:amino acid ABC transporter permease [Pelagibacterium montanilacus]|uniref:amino acid ABC transporter permease n=1 Tax=Pelagibacterium montanilacus TaxID=2185280 RepID=UPI000F8C62BF|nr:amino acid ABC transporter permease [Pelagibacterium montanilacus]
MFGTSITWGDISFMLSGAGLTLAITFWAMLGGTLAGLVFGVIRAQSPWYVNYPLGTVLDVLRSVPLLIQFILFNSFQSIIGLNMNPFVVGCAVLAAYTAAFCTEIVRGGILSVPTTTRRAARSLGLTYWQDLREIVLPLGTRVMLPSWIGLTLGVMKDTALVYAIGVIELLRSSQIIITRKPHEALVILAIAGLMYFIVSFPVSRLGAHLERKWREND